ncbi:hypothetical protein K502DRAFT_310976 [Neoconidiobolus thromboides FSU 785]|nr:hypothetical protein K502DRAFT_310976 [Neoconidiobolus thromboides FSU 785]
MNFGINKLNVVKSTYYSSISSNSIFSTPKTILQHIDNLSTEPLEDSLLYFDLTASQIECLTQDIIDTSQQILDQISVLKPEECNSETVISKLADLETWTTTYTSSCTFPMYISKDKEVRQACSKAYQELSKHSIQSSMRMDIYYAVCNAKKNMEVKEEMKKLSDEDKRYINKLLEDYHKLGFHLETEKRQLLSDTLVELSDLSNQFSNNVAADNTTVQLKKSELEGLPEFYFSTVKKVEDGEEGEPKFEITMKYPDINPILEKAKNSDIRKKIEFVYNSRCEQNIPLLERALVLREKVAKILDYENYAEYRLKGRMADKPKIVFDFLEDLKNRFEPLLQKELYNLLELKKEEDVNANELESWDMAYYKEKLISKECNIDQEKIQEYFPLPHVTEQMFNIYSNLFNIEFTILNKTMDYWDPEVDLVKVSDKDSKEVLGYFYLDLYPREGKFTHAACFPLQPGCEFNQQFQYPIVAMVCNFTSPNQQLNRPSLLRHYEVITYFHELGHVLHCVLSKPKYSKFTGVNVEHDFVETPSQLLENWCWDQKELKLLSKHYQTGKPLEDTMIDNLILSKNLTPALFWSRQLVFAFYDMYLHTGDAKSINTTEFMKQLRYKILKSKTQPNTFSNATFNHIMGGYDAGYYGYLWALVYSADIYHTLFKNQNDNDNQLSGKLYRNIILNSGGSKDAINMLKQLLNREPSADHFIQSFVGDLKQIKY